MGKKRYLNVKIPKGFMNCGVTIDNIFVADTNDSANWDKISFPLPKSNYRWEIHSYLTNNIVVLVDYKT